MGKIFKTLLCIPVVNVFLFAFMPHKAYREFFLGYIEAHGKSLAEVWEKASEREKQLLCLYNIYKPDDNRKPTPSSECSEGDKEGTDNSGVCKTD